VVQQKLTWRNHFKTGTVCWLAITMLVFIDESGDPGLKLECGSSPYFAVSLVAFRDLDEANAADHRISELRGELRLQPSFEFHFNKLCRDYRVCFLQAVAAFQFFYFGIVINKAKLYGPGFHYKEPFYKYACSLVVKNAKANLVEATVVIDGSGTKDFRLQLGKYLKNRINDPGAVQCIRKVKVADSHRNNLLQLADMVCGAVARSYRDKKDRRLYRDIIRQREKFVQVWPR
jgi:hypothetical protein